MKTKLNSKSVYKKIISLFILALLMSTTITNFANAGTGVYYTSNGYVSQSPYSFLCWAACSSSMLQTRGVNISVKDYATRALGGTFADVPRNAYEVAGYLNSLYNIGAYRTSQLGFTALESNMRLNKPVFAGITFINGAAHMVLISGTDSTANQSLCIMDPLYGWQYPTYSGFYSGYQGDGHYFESIVY